MTGCLQVMLFTYRSKLTLSSHYHLICSSYLITYNIFCVITYSLLSIKTVKSSRHCGAVGYCGILSTPQSLKFMKLSFYLVCVTEARGFILFRETIVYSENCTKCVYCVGKWSVCNVADGTAICLRAVVHKLFEYELQSEIPPVPHASSRNYVLLQFTECLVTKSQH